MSIVGLQQVCKKFGPIFAGDKVSFKVNEGELFGLPGPNGVGKITFIRLVLDIFQVKHFEISMPTLDEIFIQVVQEPTMSQ
jgi:ABC-type uncharacterized transport system ATPase subunit